MLHQGLRRTHRRCVGRNPCRSFPGFDPFPLTLATTAEHPIRLHVLSRTLRRGRWVLAAKLLGGIRVNRG